MKKGLLYFLVLISLSGCTINKQVKEIKTLAKCTFALGSIDKIEISGTDVSRIVQTGEINLMDMPALALGILTRNVPLNTRFNLEITNPTVNKAAINQFDYQLFINKQELIEGTMDEHIQIPPNGNISVPLEFSFNMYKFLSNDSIRKDIQDFIQKSRNGEVKNALLTIKIRPSILIGGQLVKYPNFITIEKAIDNQFLIKL